MTGLVRWLQARLGSHWPAAVKTADSATTTFLLTFLGTFAAHGITTETVTTRSTWGAAALAGVVAALNLIKSALMTGLTGQPALGGLVSNQLRAQRDMRPVKHKVPLTKPRPRAARTKPKPPEVRTPPPSKHAEPKHGAHEAKED